MLSDMLVVWIDISVLNYYQYTTTSSFHLLFIASVHVNWIVAEAASGVYHLQLLTKHNNSFPNSTNDNHLFVSLPHNRSIC